MTEADLAPLAKAGDRRAVEELLRRSRDEVKAIVVRTLRRQRVTFDLYEDALAEGMVAVWRAILSWDPALAPLMGFAEKGVRRSIWRLAALRGHALSVPYAPARKAKTVNARAAAMGKARSLDAPVSDDVATPLVEALPAEHADPADFVDARRVLAALGERDVDIVLRHMDGDTRADMGRDFGLSKEMANRLFHRAMSRARKATVAPFRRAA